MAITPLPDGSSPEAGDLAPFVRVGLLGPLTIAGEDLPPGLSVKAKAVFAYLAAQGGAAVPRDRLADLCWERSGPEQARQSLRQALSQLRRELPAFLSEHLVASPEQVRLVGIESDTSVLEHAVASPDPALWGAALAHVRGLFAADLETGSPAFDDWAARERMRYLTVATDLLARLAAFRLDEKQLEAAIEAARRLLALDPLREDGQRLLISALAAAGRRAEALAQYNELEQLLREELAVQPDPATRALVDDLRDAAAVERQSPPGPGAMMKPAPASASAALLSRSPIAGQGGAAPSLADAPSGVAPDVTTTKSRGRSLTASLIGLALVIAAGLAAWWFGAPRPASGPPVLVVRALEPMSPEPETAALARALTTRLSGGLSSVPTIRVRSAEGRGPEPDLRVEGSVQAADGGALVTARLVRASGEVLQQVEFKAPPRPTVEMQDEILGRVGRLITEKLDEVAYPWSITRPGASQAMDTALTARNLANRGDTSDRVTELFRTAMQQDPDNLQIKALFANALAAQAGNSGLPQDRKRDLLAEAMRLFTEVETTAPHLQTSVYGRCQTLRVLADLQANRAACERSRALMPWSARVYKELGYTMLLLGVLDQADGYFQAAERLDRVGTIRWTWAIGAGVTALLRGQPDVAGHWLQTAATLRPNARWYPLFAAVAARRNGDEEAVKRHLARFRELPATTSLSDYFESFFPSSISYPGALQDGLTQLKAEMAELMR